MNLSKLVTVGSLATLLASPALADRDLLSTNWPDVKVAHLRIQADFAGEPTDMFRTDVGQVGGRQAKVTDRFEIDLDLNLGEMKVVGTPVLANFPSSAVIVEAEGCPPTRVDGKFELATAVSARDLGGALDVQLRKDYAAGAFAYAGEGPCNAWTHATSKSETSSMTIPLGLTGLLMNLPAMKQMGMALPNLTPDQKAFASPRDNAGWALVITPTPK